MRCAGRRVGGVRGGLDLEGAFLRKVKARGNREMRKRGLKRANTGSGKRVRWGPREVGRWIYLGLIVGLLTILAVANFRLYTSVRLDGALAQLAFLERVLNEGAAERMQEWFPEGYVFTWALYGLAAAQAAEALDADDPRRDPLFEQAWRAVDAVDSPKARSTFDPDLTPPYGAFYCGWSLYLRGVLLKATGPDVWPAEILERLESDCRVFAEALRARGHPYLPSYEGQAWPADTVTGIAGLALRDRVLGSRFEGVIADWLEQVRAREDPDLGTLSHAADVRDGSPLLGTRGSSLALMSRLLVEVDPAYARDQYERLRRYFVDYRWGLPGVREYPHGVRGRGDVDSGPLVLGYSGPAMVVGGAAARAHGDEELAGVLLSMAEAAGFPVTLFGHKRYLGGLVPVGDAFFAWAHTTPVGPGVSAPLEPLLPRLWRLGLHTLSLPFAALAFWRIRRLWRENLTG